MHQIVLVSFALACTNAEFIVALGFRPYLRQSIDSCFHGGTSRSRRSPLGKQSLVTSTHCYSVLYQEASFQLDIVEPSRGHFDVDRVVLVTLDQ